MTQSQSISRSPGVDHEQDGITVTEITGGNAGESVLGSVFGVYEQHGYEAGYRHAVLEMRLSLLGLTEDLIRRRDLNSSQAADLRRAVWALHEELQRRTAHSGADIGGKSGFVEGGLGI